MDPLKLHEFRHSCGSNLLRGGLSIRLVAKWLGDTEVTLLGTYSHEFPDEKNMISDWLNSN